ncbi:hypothetical protein THF1C08_570018 [Vibrio jasicida]|uniref:Uncharacterized protein n=1 Tax=Vibrio jasicida TaxID=766224 RepID=A0AAU9QVI6_9VIBR|nr:hypothetical protein THF1C08_570018 [Vibrio jasicida]CAH1602441.1 hypothetical protein THF1A12_580018 [Vibrio jasicida]
MEVITQNQPKERIGMLHVYYLDGEDCNWMHASSNVLAAYWQTTLLYTWGRYALY